MFRPGFIQPMHGITSRTRLYRVLYANRDIKELAARAPVQ